VLRAGGRFLVNAFERDSKDGRGVGQFAAVSANEVELVVRLRERLYQVGESDDVGGGGDSGDESVAEREAPLALIPKRQVELLYEQAGFSELSVVGGFDGEPPETVNQEMVLGGHPTDTARRKTSVKDRGPRSRTILRQLRIHSTRISAINPNCHLFNYSTRHKIFIVVL
jgi:hypothetical protein